MKTQLLAVLSIVMTLAGTISPVAHAEPILLQLDPTKSSITLSGTVNISGFILQLEEQGVNSLIAKYDGTIPVDVSAGHLQFLGGAAIRALEPNAWAPGLGGASGTTNASYGAKATFFTATAFAASRHLVLDATSANLPLASGKFAGGDLNFKFVDTANATLDFLATGLISAKGTKILSGYLTNRVASVGLFEGSAGDETLTLPVHTTLNFEAATDAGITVKFELGLDGQLVAKRATVVEEPKVVFTPPAVSGAPISLNWSKSYKLQRATTLTPPNWTDVAATSPITIPPIQPGEYFRVIKK